MNIKMKYGHCVNCGAILTSEKCKYCDTVYIIEKDAPVSTCTQFYQEKLSFNGYKFIMEYDDCSLDIDIFAILLRRDKLQSCKDVIFYNNPKIDGIFLNERYGNEISVNLSELSYGVNRIVFGFSIYDAYKKCHNIGMIENGRLIIRDIFTNKDVIRFDNICEKGPFGSNYIFAELIRGDDDNWEISIVDNVLRGHDLNDVISYY